MPAASLVTPAEGSEAIGAALLGNTAPDSWEYLRARTCSTPPWLTSPTRHGRVHRLARMYRGEWPAELLARVPATAEPPTLNGFVAVDAGITAKAEHLVHVLHADDTGKTVGTWLPPRLVHPRGTTRRVQPPAGGGEA